MFHNTVQRGIGILTGQLEGFSESRFIYRLDPRDNN
jgi:hypothetical protein